MAAIVSGGRGACPNLVVIATEELRSAESPGRCYPFYLFRLAAFHFAQRARWAAAIRLRAAADIGLRPLGLRIPFDFLSEVPRLPKAANAAFSRAISPCTRFLSFLNCRTTPVSLGMVPPIEHCTSAFAEV
jgi:hypothetical protein